MENIKGEPMTAPYWPTTTQWLRSEPEHCNLDPSAIERAVDFAIANESKMNRNIRQALEDAILPNHHPSTRLWAPSQIERSQVA